MTDVWLQSQALEPEVPSSSDGYYPMVGLPALWSICSVKVHVPGIHWEIP